MPLGATAHAADEASRTIQSIALSNPRELTERYSLSDMELTSTYSVATV